MPSGLEEFFFEPIGEEKISKWNQVGPKKGSYIQIETFQNVGRGFGDFEKGASGDFHRVSQGSGAYKQIQTYQHVGPGLGNFDKEDVTSYSGWKVRPCCLVILLIALVLLAALIAYLLTQSSDATVPSARKGHVYGHSDFDSDCNAGYATWQTSWSESKKSFCCSSIGVACSQTVYDCNADYDHWQSLWSSEKKEFCCARRGRGCIHENLEPYNCEMGLENWQSNWTRGKQLWCCSTHQLGCPEFALSFDCQAGYATWETGWSWAKKHWCCAHEQRGCEGFQYSKAFDCQAGLSRWRTGWSHAKKAWCCTQEHVACQEPFDCHAGLSNWRHGWSERKQRYCCHSHSLGCETISPPFDCSAGFANWQHGWSTAKKHWCCEQVHRGCATATSTSPPTTSPSAPTTQPPSCRTSCSLHGHRSSCAERITDSATHDFAHEEEACSKAFNKVLALCDVCSGCSFKEAQCKSLPVEKPVLFDCQAGIANLDAGWSTKKKDWCCANHGVGCPTSFDCDAGLSNFHAAWSQRKKSWCCYRHGKGCQGPHPPHLTADDGFQWKRTQVRGYWTWIQAPLHADEYDCQAAYHNFVHAWSHSKQHWCCLHKGVACTGPNPPAVHLGSGNSWVHVKIEGVWTWRQVPRTQGTPSAVDCSTGLDRAASWAPDRKKYCCTHEGKACNPP